MRSLFSTSPFIRRATRARVGILLPLLAFAFSGCGVFGGRSPGVPVAAQYYGLANKSVAIVIYIPSASLNEFPGAREEISSFIVRQMQLNLPTTRLLNPRDVINFQDTRLNWEAMTERDLGKTFSVDRVLYIEVLDYTTRRTIGYSDLQGHIRAQCKVVETDSDSPRPAWTGLVDVSWPQDRMLDPTQTNETILRKQVLEQFADRLVRYFYDHQELRGTLNDGS